MPLRGQSEDGAARAASTLSAWLDRVAAACMFSIMGLVVLNVILRGVFSRSILGTYEYVGFLTAVMIGFSVAHCAYNRSHIAVDYFMMKVSRRKQVVGEIFVTGLAFVFWAFAAWHLGKYAYTLSLRGVVSPTTQTPYYYVIYLVAGGLFVLALILLVNLIEYIKRFVIK